jgi:hypothetical protein
LQAQVPAFLPEVVRNAKHREVAAQAAAKMASRVLAGEIELPLKPPSSETIFETSSK